MKSKRDRDKQRKTIITYSVLGAVVIALVSYITLRRGDRMQYDLPELEKVNISAVDNLIITRTDNEKTEVVRQGEDWIITPEGYKADFALVRGMLEAIGEFKVTDLVSSAEYYEKYELDDGHRYQVTAKSSGNTLLTFFLGKRAPSYNHTYITLPNDKNIYHAAGDIRKNFDLGTAALRDKTILNFDSSTVMRISVQFPDREILLSRSTSQDSDSEQQVTVWKTPEDEVWDQEKIDDLLSRLSKLKCSSYLSDGEKPSGAKYLTIRLAGSEDHELVLHEKTDSGYPADSTGSEFAFMVSSFQGNAIVGAFETEEETES